MLFERTAISKKPSQTIKNDLVKLSKEKELSPNLAFRDPYGLDFLELHDTYSEKDLENAILHKMKDFLVEMGSDFAFMGQQKHITIGNEDFYIDLLFYHRSWKRLIVIELKLGKFQAAYKGQMELYLRYLEKYEMRESENKPIGLVLCADKNKEQVELLTLDNNQIEVAEYKTKIPDRKLFAETLHEAVKEARKEFAELGEDRGCINFM
jgi:predicted nuclease of restriction endonuclease-like (RecB) superfamily